jgi:hypothetical protein
MDLSDPGDHEGPVPTRSERISLDPNDPKLIERLVEELKSQGVLDDIRKECLAEVDTKVRGRFTVLKCQPLTFWVV